MRIGRFLIAVALCWVGAVQVSEAHESRPLYVEITEHEGGILGVKWRTPASVPRNNIPDVALPACQAASPVGTTRGPGGPVRQRLYRCAEGTTGGALEIRYPLFNPSVSTLLQVRWSSGETRSVLASPKETAIALPGRETTGGVAKEYFVLGIDHIRSGYDHLLFVACLVLIAGTLRRVLITITGFTIAHSITLALAALELVRLPVPPVEASIALSVIFLATELVRNRRETLTWRYPIAVSASFGLLHGFGFASVLAEIGLPQTEVPTALLFFNVGVEAGQVVFVLSLVGAMLCALLILRYFGMSRVLTAMKLGSVQRSVGYGVGVFASIWLVDRVAGFWI
jgi:hydrogenase/urease accessory protein HupE